MRAERTRYAVPGWGVGELWTSERLVLAHDFDFRSVSDTGAGARSGLSQPGSGERVISGPQKARFHAAFPCGAFDTDLARLPLDTNRCLTPKELVGRLEAFLAGQEVRLDDVPLDLGWCTPFQRAVATALYTVPRGEVVSYGELAALAGYPGAQRAVGTFCARNRFMLLVPCHRVVGASGIGPYGSAGVPVKRRLLALEGVAL